MKKNLILVVTILAVLFLGSCNFGTKKSEKLFQTDEDILGFSALSSVTALNHLNDKNANLVEEVSFASYETFSNEVDEEEIEDYDLSLVENYLSLIKSLKDKQGFKVEVVESDNDNYETLLIINLLDINNEQLDYQLYYNETIIDDEESKIEGIMVVLDMTYHLQGKKEIEVDDEETEESLELKAYIDENNYVLLSYEIETEENEFEKEFKYSIYQNGKLIKSINIEFETEEDETEITLIFIEGSIKKEYEFEFEDDEIEIKIKVKNNEGTIINKKIKLKIINNEVFIKEIIEDESND